MDSKNNNSDINQFADDIRQAIDVMNRGGIIAYPTDTIWGLGCDATNADAVRRIYEIKRRDDSKALITLVDSEAKVEFYVKEVPEVAWQLISDKILKEFAPELERFTVDTVHQDKDGKPTVERVRTVKAEK